MSEITLLLGQIEQGDPAAAEQLLPLVYNELRKFAAAKMAGEQPGHTLQATALVHEAYLKLVDVDQVQHWDSRGHFFAAAAQAMRQILVDAVRRKRAGKRGGSWQRVTLTEGEVATDYALDDVLALNDALEQLAVEDQTAARLATLRIFGGLSIKEAARTLELPYTSAQRQWTYAQAWLKAKLCNRE